MALPTLGRMGTLAERRCATCGTQNLVSARFCARCGTRFSGSCHACGAELPVDAHFCPECGSAVVQVAVTEGEERKLVTVLFSDVEGSTSLGERLDAERLKEVMGAYFDAMQAEIEAEGGTVEKFIGDAVMAVFGVPVAHEDDPVRALRAAQRMLSRLNALNRDLEREYGVTLAMRIGVNTGEVVATALPAPGRGMVAGDAVNVAARLEQMARSGHVLVGPRTARAAARRVALQDIGSRQLRGKEEPVQVFELLDVGTTEAAGTTAMERPRGSMAPLVGRERELALLESVFERVTAEGRPHLVTIYGEAGVGKSRLVEEFEGRAVARADALISVRGRCLSYGDGVTYWPLAEILKAHAGVLDDDPPALVLTKFSDAVDELLAGSDVAPSRRETVLRGLAFTVGIEGSDGRSPESDPRRIRTETQEAWRTFFSALATPGPVVAVIEDIHWADAALLDLLEDLADRTRGGVLFICPSRQELRERRPMWGGGRLNFSSALLEPLSGPDSDTLLGHLLGSGGLPAALRRRILQRAGGNPFFLEEIVRHLLDEGRLAQGAGEAPSAPEMEDFDIPETVQGVLAARMDLLESGDKRVLQKAAVVGKTFWSGAVEQLLEADDRVAPALGDALIRLEDRGLVLSRIGSTMGGEREYAFRHVLTRDVAYQSLPRRDRAGAHAAVGAWIEERAAERLREFAELLSHHYQEALRDMAEDPRRDTAQEEALRSKAFRFTLLASEAALSKAVLGKAQTFAEGALNLAADDLERSMALEAAGLAYFHDSQGDLAWKALKRAIDIRVQGTLAREEDARDIARLCAAALEITTRRRGAMRQRIPPEQLEPYLRIGLEHAGEEDSEERARLLIARSFWPRAESAVSRVDQRSLAEARRIGEDGFAMAQRLGRPLLGSAALDAVCSTYHLQGRYGPMEEPLRRRLQLAGSLEDPFEVGDIFGMAAWWALNSGRYREAFGFADRGLAETESRSSMYALYCLDFRAAASFRLGEWERFLSDVAMADELLGDRRDTPPGFAAVHVAQAAFLHEVQGDTEGANRSLRIIEWLERVEESPDTAWTLWRSKLLARRREFDEARGLLTRPAIADSGEGREEVLEAWCELVAEEERWGDAPAVANDARAHGEWAGVVSLPPYADRLEGRAALASGDHPRATELLVSAGEGFEALEAAWEVAVTRLDVTRALLVSGRRDEARAHLQLAVPTLERLRSRRELATASDLRERLA
ncbi:MAG TPA: AAA family ATPase [Actinomycetota bacterium]